MAERAFLIRCKHIKGSEEARSESCRRKMSAKALGQRHNSWTSMWKSGKTTVAKPSGSVGGAGGER